MMQTLTLLLLLCALIATGFSAPTQTLALQDLLAEIQDANAATRQDERTARIEQETFKDLAKSALNDTINYLRLKFLKPTASDQHVGREMAGIQQETFKALSKFALNKTLNYLDNKFLRPKASGQDTAETEETRTWKDLLRKSLNHINDYAQNKLRPSSSSELAMISQKNWKELLGGVLDEVNEYAQHKLGSPRDDTMASNEEETFKDLLASLLSGANNYAQHKLALPEETETARIEISTLKELLGSLLDVANNYAQNKLQPTETAEEEQESLEDLFGSLINGANNYVQTKLDDGPMQPMDPAPRRSMSSSKSEYSESRNYQTSQYNMPSNADFDGGPAGVGGSQGREEVDEQALPLDVILPLVTKYLVPLLTNLFANSNDPQGTLDSLLADLNQ